MEVVNNQEDQTLMGSNEYLHVVKGKRTKRQRPLSPLTLPAMTTSTSSSGGGDDEKPDNNNFPSPTTSVEFSVISSEEEEDMANCLILLAQGGHKRSKQIDDDYVDDENGKMARINSRRFYNDAAAATTSKAAGAGPGLYLYECKTCNKCFSSFQALGGHRASHKRPHNKGTCNEEMKTPITKTSSLLMLTEQESPQHHQFNDNSNNNNIASSTTCARPSLVLQMGNSSSLSAFNNNKSRVHECSICGSEFSSGQALGGHMRRHRTTNATTATTTATTSTNIDFSHHQDNQLNFSNKKAAARNVLSLDLNLPAPEEDYSSKFSLFSSSQQQPQQQPLVFSASALVDCHY
ncbi:hypothetical protein MKX03_029991 [Papaver bracteatum]|nr:hypothetical protein MKX03_029991 [Papaver bracteatum]